MLATRIWDGGSLLNDRWKEPKNWVDDVAPVTGDDLVFPAGIGALDRGTNNDFNPGTLFHSITFTGDGYALSGNRFALGLGGIRTVGVDLGNTIATDISLPSGTPVIGFDGASTRLTLSGRISGAGGLQFGDGVGFGIVSLSGNQSNDYAGPTTLLRTAVQIFKNAIAVPGDLSAVGGSISINFGPRHFVDSARVSLNATDVFLNSPEIVETVGAIDLNKSRVSGPGTLVMDGPIHSVGDSSIQVAELRLAGGFGSTITVDGTDPLVITSTITAGAFVKDGVGTLTLAGTQPNTSPGGAAVNAGTLVLQKPAGVNALSGAFLAVGDGAGGVNVDRVVLAADNQIANTVGLEFTLSGELDLQSHAETIAGLRMSGGRILDAAPLKVNGQLLFNPAALPASIFGVFDLQGTVRTFRVNGDAVHLFVGAVLTNGGINKRGTGQMQLTANNTYAMATKIAAGALIVDGNQTQSQVQVNGGTLKGKGRTGSIVATSGGVSPGGGSLGGPGILTTKNTQFTAGASLDIELNGRAAGTKFDQLKIVNPPGLQLGSDGSRPVLNVELGFVPTLNDRFKIVSNGGTSPVDGFFVSSAGQALTEGAVFTVGGGKSFRINYASGDGNDVVLTHVNTPPAFVNRTVTTPPVEGGVAELTGTITEPDPDDVFFLDVNWGDGTRPQTYVFPPGSPRTVSVTHRYLDDRPSGTPADENAIQIVWRDQHGGSNSAAIPITINNVAPKINELQFLRTGDPLALLSGSIVDPGQCDTFQLSVDWGDGSAVESFHYDVGVRRFELTHHFADSNSYQVTLTLTDDDGGELVSDVLYDAQPPRGEISSLQAAAVDRVFRLAAARGLFEGLEQGL